MCFGICTSAICCAGAACCSCLCLPAKAAGVAAKNFAKIGYVVFSVSWVIMSVILMYFFNWLFDWTDTFGMDCPGEDNSACAGASVMVRTSFSLAIFHIVMVIICAFRTNWAAQFHDGCWGFKFLIVALILVPMLWVPNDPFFNGYLEFARIVSVIFLMYQALLMLLVAYSINDVLVGNVKKENYNICTCSGIILIIVFVVFLAGDITWLVFTYIKFANEGCGSNITFAIITTIVGVFQLVIVLFRTRDDASVLTSSIVWAYQLYLQWSAFSSGDDPKCNPYMSSAGNTTAEIVLGMFFTFLALITIGGSTTRGNDSTLTQDMSAHMMEKEEDTNQPAVDVKDQKGEVVKNASESHVFPISTATILFQVLMILASIYYSMLLTNWGTPSVMSDSYNFFQKSPMSYWTQMVALWVAQIIYCFSLLAPVCFPNRDFGTSSH